MIKAIYGESIKNREELLQALLQAVGACAHCGKTLDAVWDILSEKDTPYHFKIYGVQALKQNLGTYYLAFEKVLVRVQKELKMEVTMEQMTLEKARDELKTLQEKMSAYNHAMALLQYDGATTAPKGTGTNRAHSMAILSEESYHLSTCGETLELLTFLDAHKELLTQHELRVVYLLLKELHEMSKIPPQEYVALQKLLVLADDVWHTAKEKNDFAAFEPYLKQIFESYIRVAGYCAPEKEPYDYWLNRFEEGLTMARCDEFFATLRAHIVPLLAKVKAKPQVDSSILEGDFPVSSQEKLADKLMHTMGLDMNHCALGTTEHPFTTSLGSHQDVRITTNYKSNNFSASMFSVVHEGGHALYDMGSDDTLAYTVLDGGVSMGIHESQSRFYENYIGRSKAFSELVFPMLEGCFAQQMQGYTAQDLYQAVNKAQPSLTRIEADELTYSLHIMIRYELERRVMNGTLQVHELPEEWNRLYKEYLGVDVPNDKEGILQDIHWASGSIGYFPSYALGSAYAAQLLRAMEKDVDVEACILRGDFTPINEWNRAHIWKHGCLYTPQEVFQLATGEAFDATVFTTYLEEKYTELYDL
ncbi:barstar family protein [Ruminococcaceae bacterium OttesenSCG-928-N02]|nr:barstar family protein [Ruminococcaceae bacterium OttesenSCG-928-N02]